MHSREGGVGVGQIDQQHQEIEDFWVQIPVIVGIDLVAFQELGDEGENTLGFELVAGVASEQFKGGAIGFFCKHDCASSENYFLCERLKWENLRKIK